MKYFWQICTVILFLFSGFMVIQMHNVQTSGINEHFDIALRQRALLSMKNRDYERALTYSKLMDYAPEFEPCLIQLVNLGKQIKESPDDYKLYLERANLLSPSIEEISSNKENACTDYNAAIEDYTTVIKLNPNQKEVYERRAHALGMSMNGVSYKNSEKEEFEKKFQKKREMMLSDYKKSVELNEPTKKRLAPLAVMYCRSNQTEEGIKIFQNLIKEDNDPILNYGLGICYAETDQLDKAIENFNFFLENSKKCEPHIECDEDGYRAFYTQRAYAYKKQHKNFAWFMDISKTYLPISKKTLDKFCKCK